MAYPVIATVAASATPADATSHVCTLPASIAAGDLLLAVVVCRGSAAMTWPAGWTAITNGAGASGTALRSEARYRIADGAEGASITITGGSVAWVSRAWRITGSNGAAPVCAAATGTSADVDPPALGSDVYAMNSLWLVHVAWDGRPACSFWPAPFSASGRLAEHVADSGGGSGWVKQLSAGIVRDTRGLDPGPLTSADNRRAAVAVQRCGGGGPEDHPARDRVRGVGMIPLRTLSL